MHTYNKNFLFINFLIKKAFHMTHFIKGVETNKDSNTILTKNVKSYQISERKMFKLIDAYVINRINVLLVNILNNIRKGDQRLISIINVPFSLYMCLNFTKEISLLKFITF